MRFILLYSDCNDNKNNNNGNDIIKIITITMTIMIIELEQGLIDSKYDTNVLKLTVVCSE